MKWVKIILKPATGRLFMDFISGEKIKFQKFGS